MPDPPDRPVKRTPLLEYGVVALVAALALGYAVAAYVHESVGLRTTTVSSTATNAR